MAPDHGSQVIPATLHGLSGFWKPEKTHKRIGGPSQ